MALPSHAFGRREREISGVTNRHVPHALKDQTLYTTAPATLLNCGAPRDVERDMRDSAVISAERSVELHRRHAKEAPPPPLPSAVKLYHEFPTHSTSVAAGRSAALGRGGVALGIASIMPAPDGSDHARAGLPLERVTSVPSMLPRRATDWISDPISASPSRRHTDGSASKSAASTPVGAPQQQPAFRLPWQPDTNTVAAREVALQKPIDRHHRVENSGAMHRATFSLIQPEPSSALYMAPAQQFDSYARGLNSGLLMQEEKLKSAATKEIKTGIRRGMESAVIASRQAEADKLQRLEQGRIRSKGQQLDDYVVRLSKYKFTA